MTSRTSKGGRFRYRAWDLSTGQILICVYDRDWEESHWEIYYPSATYEPFDVLDRKDVKNYLTLIVGERKDSVDFFDKCRL
jgi:hypothetical protein